MPNLLPGTTADISELQRFANIKFVVADLDGTIFPSEVAVTMQLLLRRLNRSHVLFTLATGRAFGGVEKLLQQLEDSKGSSLLKQNVPLILYNGSIVVEAGNGSLIYGSNISSEAFLYVLNLATRYPCEVFAYFCDDSALSPLGKYNIQERVLGFQFQGPEKSRIEREFNGLLVEWINNISFVERCSPHAILIASPNQDCLAEMAVQLQESQFVSVTRSGSVYLELRPLGNNKGVALAWVANQLGFEVNQILAIGDNDNDVEMLKYAGIGVAVNSASNLAKQNADFVCRHGPFRGVVEVLRLICEAHRYYRGCNQKGELIQYESK